MNRSTHQFMGPRANTDEVLATQAKVVVPVLEHVRHTHTQLLPLLVHVVRQPTS